MSMPFPFLTAVLDEQTDDVLDFIDSHVPGDFQYWESETLPDDVLDVLDSWEVELVAALSGCADCKRGQCAPHRNDF